MEKTHTHSFRNLEEVLKSNMAGCFHCMHVFNVKEELLGRDFEEYCLACEDDGIMEPTVFCPFCGIDSVLGDASGLPVGDHIFLKDMYERWFTQKK